MRRSFPETLNSKHNAGAEKQERQDKKEAANERNSMVELLGLSLCECLKENEECLKKLTEKHSKESEEMMKELNYIKYTLKKTYVLVEVVQTQCGQIEDLYQKMDEISKNSIKKFVVTRS